jgi:hypothetical protein
LLEVESTACHTGGVHSWLRSLVALLAIAAPLLPTAAALPAPAAGRAVAFVAIDDEAERRYGGFPVPRTLYADAIDRVRAMGGKAVALKFFFDQPSDAANDAALTRALGAMPVLLQAQLMSQAISGSPEAALGKMALPGAAAPRAGIEGARGLFPLAALAEKAAAVGFVDILDRDLDRIALVGSYRGRAVKSLLLEIVEAAFGAATVRDVLRWDAQGRVTCAIKSVRPLPVLPLTRLLDGALPAEQIAGKVVMIGYTGSKSPTLDVGGVRQPIHLIFAKQVACLVDLIAAR